MASILFPLEIYHQGGGFQGGAILTTAYLAFYFISEDKNIDLTKWVKFEKVLFFLLIIAGFLSVLSKDVYFTNPILNDSMISKRVFYFIKSYNSCKGMCRSNMYSRKLH